MRGRSDSQLVSWDEFAVELSKVTAHYKMSYYDAMQLLGYADNSNLSAWKNSGKAPLLALNAAKWVAHDAGAPQAPKLTETDISRIFAVLAGIPIPPEQMHELRGKLATQLSQR
jgi:hypothetical protein